MSKLPIRRICTCALAVCIVAECSAQVAWSPSYKTARAESRQTGKATMVLIVSIRDAASKRLLDDIETNRKLSQALGDFVCVKLDADEDRSLISQLRAEGSLPTTVLLGAHPQSPSANITGYDNPDNHVRKIKSLVMYLKGPDRAVAASEHLNRNNSSLAARQAGDSRRGSGGSVRQLLGLSISQVKSALGHEPTDSNSDPYRVGMGFRFGNMAVATSFRKPSSSDIFKCYLANYSFEKASARLTDAVSGSMMKSAFIIQPKNEVSHAQDVPNQFQLIWHVGPRRMWVVTVHFRSRAFQQWRFSGIQDDGTRHITWSLKPGWKSALLVDEVSQHEEEPAGLVTPMSAVDIRNFAIQIRPGASGTISKTIKTNL